MLRLVTFGGVAVLADGGEVRGAAAQPRRLAMLAVLARAGDRGMSRARVLDLFWPDEADDERRRKALAQAIYALRRDLGDDGVITGTHELRLDPMLLPSDVHAFATCLRQGRHAEAVQHYGGPFLGGFHLAGAPAFERWLEEERQVLERDYLRAVEALATRAERDGRTDEAVVWWRKAASVDPLDSRTTLALMRALAANGEITAAIRQATIHETLIEQELELPPDREVAALAAELRTRSVAPAGGGAPTASDDTPRGPVAMLVIGDEPVPGDAPVPGASPAPDDAPVPQASALAAAVMTDAPVSDAAVIDDAPADTRPPHRAARRLVPPPWLTGLAAGLLILLVGWTAVRRVSASSDPADGARVVPSIAVGLIADFREDARGPVRSLAALLATSLARSDALQVVSAARLGELLQQGALGDSTEAAFMAAARLAGARELVDGSLFDPGDGALRLDLRRVDVRTGSVLAALTIRGSDLFALADSGTARLLEGVGAAPLVGSVRDVTTRSAVAHRFYAEGLRARAAYDLEAARRLFGEALREDPGFAMAAYEYARVNPNRAQLAEEMEQALALAQRATPRERLLIEAGWASIMQRPGLLEVADSLLRLDARDPQALLFAGEARLNRGQPADARPYLERAIALDSLALRAPRPQHCHACDAVQQLVRAGFDEDDPDAAVAAAERWTREAPQSAEAWGTFARALDFAGRHDEAAAALDRTLALNPAYPAAFVRRISNLLRQARLAEAEALARVQLTLGTLDQRLDGWWQLASVLRHQGRMQEALATVEGFRAVRDTVDGGRMALNHAYLPALLLHDAGRTRASIALFDSMARGAVRPGEHDANVLRLRTIALTAAADFEVLLGDTTALAQRLRDVEEAGRASGVVRDTRAHHYLRGLQHRARGQFDDAIREWRRALAPPVRGYHSRINLELANALLTRGQPEEAIRVIRPILRDVTDGIAVPQTEMHEVLARAHAAAGRRDSARVHATWVLTAWSRAEPAWRARAERLRPLAAP